MKFILILFNIINVLLAADAFVKKEYYLLAFFLFLMYINSNSIDKIRQAEAEKGDQNG